MQVAPLSKLLDDTFAEMGKQLPEDKREEFVRNMKKLVHTDRLENIARESMVKVFTADELNALADFYGSKEGASAMKKFGAYMALIAPSVQQEIQQAAKQLQEEKKWAH